MIVIQDADSWNTIRPTGPAMYALIAERGVADVVYGSRFHGRAHRSLYFFNYAANRLISMLFNLLYNQTLTDIETCYKMFTRESAAKHSIAVGSDDFGIEVQRSARQDGARQALAGLRNGSPVELRPHLRGGEEDRLAGRGEGVLVFDPASVCSKAGSAV